MRKQARVGVVVVAGLTIFLATIFTIGQQEHLWQRRVAYEVRFARSNGLQTGAQVSLSGMAVGSVTSLRFASDPGADYIVATIGVESDVAPRIRERTTAGIRTFGMLGDRYIELTPGPGDAAPLPPGSVIRSADPVDYEALFGQSGGDIVTNIAEVTAQLKDVLGTINRGEGLLGAMVRNKEFGDKTLADLQQTMANLEGTSRSLATVLQRVDRGEGLLGHLARDTPQSRQLLGDVTRAAKSLEQVTARLQRGQGTVPRLFEDEAYARRVLGNLDAMLANLAQITDKINRGQGSLGKLVNDPSLHDHAEDALGQLQRGFLFRLLAGAPAKAPATTSHENAP